MPEPRSGQMSGEILLAGFGVAVGDLEPWVIDRATALFTDRWLSPGKELYREGDPPEHLYFMIDGAVRLTKTGAPPYALRGRWVIGGLEGFAAVTHARTATATAAFHAMQAPARGWVELLEDSFPLARAAVVNTARGVARLEERIPALQRPASPRRAPLPSGDGSLSLVERLALLAEVRMLGEAGVQSIVDLAAASDELRFEPGATLLARGAERREMLLVVSGEVIADHSGPAIERAYGPGDIVCGVASFGAAGGAWQARAVTHTRVISFPIETWFDLMEEHFDLVRAALAALVARRELLLERLAEQSEELVLS